MPDATLGLTFEPLTLLCVNSRATSLQKCAENDLKNKSQNISIFSLTQLPPNFTYESLHSAMASLPFSYTLSGLQPGHSR
jgi:hypothetical protein